MSRHTFSFFFPCCSLFSQAASVAILPSALFCERYALGASWVFSFQKIQRNVEKAQPVRRAVRNRIDENMTSWSAVPMAAELTQVLREWQKINPYGNPRDWVFASRGTHGRTPRVGGMLVADHLRPAANQGGVNLWPEQRFEFPFHPP